MTTTDMTIRELIERAHTTARSKGWWDEGWREEDADPRGREGRPARPLGDQFANFHAELAEAWECYRDGQALWETRTGPDGKPEGFCVELADVWIRMADTIGAYGLAGDFLDALKTKLDYNETRPYRHGGLKA